MSTLFEDAIADAKQLRTLAEENAKKKIIEAMSPRIRSLIEQEIMGDWESEESFVDGDDDEISIVNMDELITSDEPIPSVKVHPGADVNIEIDADGTVEVDTGSVELELGSNPEASDDEDLLLSLNKESAIALASIIHNPSSLGDSMGICEELGVLQRKIKGFDRLLKYTQYSKKNHSLRESVRKYCTRLLKEVISLRGDVILTEGTASAAATHQKYNLVVKEMKTMSRRHAETLFDRLFETGGKKNNGELDELDIVFDDEDLGMLGVEDTEGVDISDLSIDVALGGEEEEEEISDEVVESFLRRLREQEEIEVEEETEEEEGPIEDVGEVIPVEDAEAALEDLGAALGLDVSVGEEEIEVEEEAEEVIEIDEGMLRRELRRMRRIREQEEPEDADPYLAHGGELIGDVELEVDEEDLINALADELGPPEVAEPTVEGFRRRRAMARRRKMVEAQRRQTRQSVRRRPQTRMNESRKNRALTGKLVEYKKAVGSLRNQLTEMNLFNAKLLYVNKLMQNRNLTSKQQRAIVEALDNAKTLREAKLLYKSLTASLNKRSGGRSLTEGRIARTLGSSSRSIRSASPAKSGNEVDRWAVLAGLNKDN